MVTHEKPSKEFDKILSQTQIEWGYLRGLREFRNTRGFTVHMSGGVFYGKNVDKIGRISLGKKAFKEFKLGDRVHISVKGKKIMITRTKRNP